MRIDKYLWCIRVFKTRSLSATACRAGKVKVEEDVMKASNSVKVGQVISIRRGPVTFRWEVLAIPKNRVGAKLVPEYAVDRTDPEEIEKLRMIQLSYQESQRHKLGRPTKKDRRDLDSFFND